MHFIKKLIHDQVIEVLFCPTEDQVADIFTKSLIEAKFSKLRSMLGVQEVVINGGIGSNASFLLLLCHYCKSFNPIPSCS
jgi:hydrogenase maturation factor HypF (carbamoyltransferase family)